jgi:hypothetical protein
MQQQQKVEKRIRMFTASEVAEFEYCPLTWWHEQFEPWAHADSEELFARLVELEHEHGTQAPALPEYCLIEQLLLRQGAFNEGRQQHQEHAEEVAGVEEEIAMEIHESGNGLLQARLSMIVIAVLAALALILLIFSQVFH